MLLRTQKLFQTSLKNKNITKSICTLTVSSSRKSALAYSLFKQASLKTFSSKQLQSQKLVQTPEELYTTPIYDKENPEFSELYLSLLFNLHSEELSQLKTDYNKVTEDIINLIKLYPSLSNQEAYLPKLDFILNYLYQNPDKFNCVQLIKFFQTLIDTKAGGCNLAVKLNFYIAAKLQQAKVLCTKKKNDSLEELIHVFFNHFHFCAESGFTSRHILNNFLNILGSDNLISANLFANEANVNNVIYLIALSVANINELDKNETVDKTFLEPHKDLISLSNMTTVLKLLKTSAGFFEVGNLSEKSNSRNRLFKALKFLNAEGVKLPSKLDEFLANYDASQIDKFETHELINNDNANILGNILERIGLVNVEKNKKFEFLGVDFYVEPGVCIKINHEEDYSNELPKGRVNLITRYLYLQNYDVISLPIYSFDDVSQIEQLFKERFYHFINAGYDRINDDKNDNVNNI